MTHDEIADVLSAYHENLILLAQTAAPQSPDSANYQFRTEQGVVLPQLDDLANQIRRLGSEQPK